MLINVVCVFVQYRVSKSYKIIHILNFSMPSSELCKKTYCINKYFKKNIFCVALQNYILGTPCTWPSDNFPASSSLYMNFLCEIVLAAVC